MNLIQNIIDKNNDIENFFVIKHILLHTAINMILNKNYGLIPHLFNSKEKWVEAKYFCL